LPRYFCSERIASERIRRCVAHSLTASTTAGLLGTQFVGNGMQHSIPDVFNGSNGEGIHICRWEDCFKYAISHNEEVIFSPLVKVCTTLPYRYCGGGGGGVVVAVALTMYIFDCQPLSDSEITKLCDWILETRSMTADIEQPLSVATASSSALDHATGSARYEHVQPADCPYEPRCCVGEAVNSKLAQPLVSSVFALECLRYAKYNMMHDAWCMVHWVDVEMFGIIAKCSDRICCMHRTLRRSRS
jgi:hypothetical protein